MDGRDLREGELAREHDALGALFLPKFRRVAVGRVRLRGDVQRQPGGRLFGDRKCARVRHERRVRADLAQKGEVIGERGKVALPREDIGGDINLLTACVRVADRRAQLLFRKIVGKRAERKILSAEVDRIRAVIQRRLQFFKAARRREQFRFLQDAASLRPICAAFSHFA